LGYLSALRNALTTWLNRGAWSHWTQCPHSSKTWSSAREAVAKATPLNFVSTCDIIGGNSGSPVINRAGEVVGLIFDGNIQSLTGGIAYSDEQSRAVSVDSRAMVEALHSVYKAQPLVDELKSSMVAR